MNREGGHERANSGTDEISDLLKGFVNKPASEPTEVPKILITPSQFSIWCGKQP